MSLYRQLVARNYDLVMKKVERLCLQKWRQELVSELRGDVLEIGAGTGANLPYFSGKLTSLQLCEPDDAMRAQLAAKIARHPEESFRVSACTAECIDADDNSIDCLVSTLVFCSVANPRQAMNEVFRVLRPGGRLVLMEHVAAEQGGWLNLWQRFWQPFWKKFACNCHLTRNTGDLLEQSGFTLLLRREIMRGAPAITTPMIIGVAIRP